MNSKKLTTSLKPLASNKNLKPNVLEASNKNSITKQQPKLDNKKTASKIMDSMKKKQWTNKKGQEYDGVADYDQPQLEQDQYFELQLQKSIKNEIIKGQKEKPSIPVPKNQVILPKLKKEQEKLDSTGEHKSLKMLEKEMDEQISRLMYEEMQKYEK